MAKISWRRLTRHDLSCESLRCSKSFKTLKAFESHTRTHNVFRSYGDRRYSIRESTGEDSRVEEPKTVKEIRSRAIELDHDLRLEFLELARRHAVRPVLQSASSFSVEPKFVLLVNDAIFLESKGSSEKTWTAFKDALYCCAYELLARVASIELYFLNFSQRLHIMSNRNWPSSGISDLPLHRLEQRLEGLRRIFRSTTPLSHSPVSAATRLSDFAIFSSPRSHPSQNVVLFTDRAVSCLPRPDQNTFVEKQTLFEHCVVQTVVISGNLEVKPWLRNYREHLMGTYGYRYVSGEMLSYDSRPEKQTRPGSSGNDTNTIELSTERKERTSSPNCEGDIITQPNSYEDLSTASKNEVGQGLKSIPQWLKQVEGGDNKTTFPEFLPAEAGLVNYQQLHGQPAKITSATANHEVPGDWSKSKRSGEDTRREEPLSSNENVARDSPKTNHSIQSIDKGHRSLSDTLNNVEGYKRVGKKSRKDSMSMSQGTGKIEYPESNGVARTRTRQQYPIDSFKNAQISLPLLDRELERQKGLSKYQPRIYQNEFRNRISDLLSAINIALMMEPSDVTSVFHGDIKKACEKSLRGWACDACRQRTLEVNFDLYLLSNYQFIEARCSASHQRTCKTCAKYGTKCKISDPAYTKIPSSQWIERLRTKLMKAEFKLCGTDEKQTPTNTTELGPSPTVGDVSYSPSIGGPAPKIANETQSVFVEHDLQGARVMPRVATAKHVDDTFLLEDRPKELENLQVKNTALLDVHNLSRVIGNVLKNARFCQLLKEVSQQVSREHLHLELREAFELYIDRLARKATSLKLDVPSNLSRVPRQCLINELVDEAYRLLGLVELERIVDNGLLVDGNREKSHGRGVLHYYLSLSGSPQWQPDIKALNGLKNLLADDEPFENMCEDIKDMILRHTPSEDKVTTGNEGQDDAEKECRDISSSRTTGFKDSDSATLDQTMRYRSVDSFGGVFTNIAWNVYDRVHPVKAGHQRVRWRCECGDTLAGDFDSLQSTELQELLSTLSPQAEDSVEAARAIAGRAYIVGVFKMVTVALISLYCVTGIFAISSKITPTIGYDVGFALTIALLIVLATAYVAMLGSYIMQTLHDFGLVKSTKIKHKKEPQECNDSPGLARSQSQSSGGRSRSGSTEDSQSSDENSIAGGSEITQITSNTSHGSSLSSQSSASGRDACILDPSFLELCINQGENVITLSEIHLRKVQDDGSLFKAIRSAYYQLRGFRRWLFLLKPIDIQYVKFCLEDRHLVGITDVPSYPTDEAIKGQIYDYRKPSIPKEVFFHLLTSTKPHKQRKWLDRLPRKLKNSIHFVPLDYNSRGGYSFELDNVTEGWGIRIVEGPDRIAMFWSTAFVACICVTVASAYQAATGDVQGATGICGSVAALWAILMPAFYFKWSVT